MNIPEHIFKAYDIRGLARGELSENLAYTVGRAFALFLRSEGVDLAGKSLVAGYDMRPTSPGFSGRSDARHSG